MCPCVLQFVHEKKEDALYTLNSSRRTAVCLAVCSGWLGEEAGAKHFTITLHILNHVTYVTYLKQLRKKLKCLLDKRQRVMELQTKFIQIHFISKRKRKRKKKK